MTARTSRAAQAPASPGALPDPGREQTAVATDMSCAMFRGFEAMRKIQQDAAHGAIARHQAAATRLHGTGKGADVLALQSELLVSDLQSAARYWQELGAAALEMHSEMMGCATHLVSSDALLEGASKLDGLEKFPGFAFWTRKAT